MLNSFLSQLVPNIQNLGAWSYWLIFAIFFGESLVLVGLIVPGAILALLFGALAAQGALDIGDVLFVSSLGFVCGDLVSYYLGKRGVGWFKPENTFFRAAHLEKGQAFFERHGNKSVIFGRYIGFVRPFTAFIAGLVNMPVLRFLTLDIISVVSWTAIHLSLGYFFGQALNSVEFWANRFEKAIIFFVIFFGLLYLIKWLILRRGLEFWQALNAVLKNRTEKIAHLPKVTRFVKAHPHFIAWLYQRLTRQKFSGLPTTLITLTLIYLISLLTGLVEGVLNQEWIVQIDNSFNLWLNGLRHPALLKLFFFISSLAKPEVVIVFALLLSAFWLVTRNRSYLIGLWVSLGGSTLLTYLGKMITARPRPLSGAYQESLFSFPSGHATVVIAFYGFFLYYFLRQQTEWRKKINWLFIWIAFVVLIGFSRLYLGVHYLSDVLTGYVLGAVWLIVGISVNEWYLKNHPIQKKKYSLFFKHLIAGTLIIFALTDFSADWWLHQRKITFARFNPLPVITSNEPLLEWSERQLPRYIEKTNGDIEQPLNVMLIVSKNTNLKKVMTTAGWQVTNQPSLSTLFTSAFDFVTQKPYIEAPLTASYWRVQTNDFGFTRHTGTRRQSRWQAKFWQTNITTTNGDQVYAGAVSLDLGVRNWLLAKKIDPDLNKARQQLVTDLRQTPAFRNALLAMWLYDSPQKISNPTWQTDGQIEVIQLQ
ncbi:MAG: LssY C-terminal domain-containing protein [Candidatus Falkowbacteria bacterium]